jgi:hypothetical protein
MADRIGGIRVSLKSDEKIQGPKTRGTLNGSEARRHSAKLENQTQEAYSP